MTILDPISGNRVTINAAGKPRSQAAESGVNVRFAPAPDVVETKTCRHDPNLARTRAKGRTTGGNSVG